MFSEYDTIKTNKEDNMEMRYAVTNTWGVTVYSDMSLFAAQSACAGMNMGCDTYIVVPDMEATMKDQ